MARPPKSFTDVAKKYVCVRVTNMDGVDLSRYRFDYDLTFAVLTMNTAGRVYHRYGGRDPLDASSWLSMKSLLHVLETSLAEHRALPPTERSGQAEAKPRRTIRDLEPYNSQKLAGRKECVHCHMVHTAERVEKRHEKTWNRRDIWIWPEPERIGLTLDPDRQDRITAVAPKSAAAEAGLRVGDRLVELGSQRIASITDVQHALDGLPWSGGPLEASIEREGNRRTVTVPLAEGWRQGTARTFAWRGYKWGLQPAPGFGGRRPSAKQLAALGLTPTEVAFKVDYLVTWGENAHLGGNAHRAGIRKGDLVLSVADQTFDSGDHFHAWFRLHCEIGKSVKVELWRGGRRLEVTLPVIAGRAF